MRPNCLTALVGAAVIASAAAAGLPDYTIVDLGLVNSGDSGSQAFAVSEGGSATGRSLGGTSSQAFSWTQSGGLVPLPNLGSRPYGVGNGANDSGTVVGTGSTTFFGTDALPLVWQGGSVSTLPLPAGESIGRAYDVNASDVAVGSVDGGSFEQAAIYAGGTGTVITTTGHGGTTMTTAFAINDSGLVAGIGTDPSNLSRNVGMVYDIDTDTMVEVGALSGLNGAIAFGISNAGHVVGSSMLNQGSGLPFIWTSSGGIAPIPLPSGTSQGSARAVNSAGWAVGTASSAFAIPFLYDGTSTHRVADLLPSGSGWDLSMNTSSSALGISEDGIIVGTGVHDGNVRAYALIPVAPCPADLDGSGDVGFGDILQIIGTWGPCAGCPEDLSGNGQVDFADILQVIASWGPCS